MPRSREIDWTDAPLARLVRQRTRVCMVRLAIDDESPAKRISLEERIAADSQAAQRQSATETRAATVGRNALLRRWGILAPPPAQQRGHHLVIAFENDEPAAADLIRRLAAAGLRLTLGGEVLGKFVA